MTKWTESEAFTWYKNQDWIVGCNYLPSNAINQLEMFQPETFDNKENPPTSEQNQSETIEKHNKSMETQPKSTTNLF